MALIRGTGDNGLAVVVDARSAMEKENDQVLDYWPLGRQALGRVEWKRTLRVALREHGTAPWTAAQTKAERDDLVGHLRGKGIRCVVPVQSPSLPGVRQVHSAWNLFGHPGNPYKWAGTVENLGDLSIAPILHPNNYEHVYSWLLARWIRQALAVAAGVLRPMPWPAFQIHPDEDALQALRNLAFNAETYKKPVAVDIETNMAGTIVTAIGLSDGSYTVSVPWHEYHIAGSEGEVQRALIDYPRGEEIQREVLQILAAPRAKKVLHNGTFDVLMLARFGIKLAGFAYDTLLMHRVVYPQYRHGLAQACATEFCISPWKQLFKPAKSKGQDEWCGDPVALREYNAKDTFSTLVLAKYLAPKVGITLS